MSTHQLPDLSILPRRIAFGSCNKHDKLQPAWARIADRNPDVFVWLGDIMYADAPVFLKLRIPADAAKLARYYAAQKAVPEYARFIEHVPVVGVYDDHDYGANDGTKHYNGVARAAVQHLLLNFLDEPAGTPRRERVSRGEGVFVHYVFGRRLKLILLDNRTHRDPKDDANGAQDMLGPAQWEWLTHVLMHERTDITIIGTGLQILSRADPLIAEVWSHLPQSQARLVSLLAATNTSGAFFLTGDVHYGEMNRATCAALGYPLYDVTSSGMTHSWGGFPKAQLVDLLLMGSHRVGPWFDGFNFGEIQIDWAFACPSGVTDCAADSDAQVDAARTNISMRVLGVHDGAVHIQRVVPLAELQPNARAHVNTLGGAAYPYLMNGMRTPLHLRDMPLDAAVSACAGAQPPRHGYTDACARVMLSCTPGLTDIDATYYAVTHGVAAIGAVVALALLVTAPCAAWFVGPRLPGGRLLACGFIVAVYAACWAFIQSVH